MERAGEGQSVQSTPCESTKIKSDETRVRENGLRHEKAQRMLTFLTNSLSVEIEPSRGENSQRREGEGTRGMRHDETNKTTVVGTTRALTKQGYHVHEWKDRRTRPQQSRSWSRTRSRRHQRPRRRKGGKTESPEIRRNNRLRCCRSGDGHRTPKRTKRRQEGA